MRYDSDLHKTIYIYLRVQWISTMCTNNRMQYVSVTVLQMMMMRDDAMGWALFFG